MRKSEIFAHTGAQNDRSDWEPLCDHAAAVAASAAQKARWYAPELAELAGWLHDLGKAKARFQARLSNANIVEPHSAEGARFAQENFPGPLGVLLAQLILGHHSGLGEAETHRRRIEAAAKLALPEGWPLLRISALPEAIRSLKAGGLTERNYALAFLGRMIFSALVDADRSETGAFYRRLDNAPDPERRAPSLDDLRQRLDVWMAERDSDRPINQLRQRVHHHVRDGATLAPGLFTLTVPTGGGKTLNSLGFALDHAIRHGLDRVIMVIPYTSIVEQTAEVFRGVFGDVGEAAVLEHHSAFDWGAVTGDDEMVSLKTAAERWDRPVIVTTAVQFLESLHAARTSRCRKLHRMARAVVVLDEAQTLPRPLLRPSLAALKELARGYNTSVVLCTATQPALRRADGFQHPEGLDDEGPLAVRELAPDPEQLYEELKRVRVEQAGPLDNGELAAVLAAEPQALAIVNNRRQARAIFEQLHGTGAVWHLSTNMTPRHRRKVLARVHAELAEGRPARLVSTSLVEAGVDISFPLVMRALAGLDSVAQAAGRCNREGRMAAPGRVVVFAAEEGEDGEFAPPPELRDLAEVAARVMARHPGDPLSLAAVRDYFSEVYWKDGHAMDAGKVEGRPFPILYAITHAGDREPIFPYRQIAEAYRIIPEGAQPVVILGGDWGLPEAELARLGYVNSAAAVARGLQSYQVQVPERVRAKMLGDGVLRCFRPQEFGSQFLLLDQPGLYDPDTGLRWDSHGDLGFLSI